VLDRAAARERDVDALRGGAPRGNERAVPVFERGRTRERPSGFVLLSPKFRVSPALPIGRRPSGRPRLGVVRGFRSPVSELALSPRSPPSGAVTGGLAPVGQQEGGTMALYEHVFLVRQDATPQQVDALVEQFKTVVEAGGGKFAKVESWGLRSLTYRIRKNRKAHYALINIDAPHAAVAEMERQMSISEDVIRFMTVRVEKHEEGPSAVLLRRERDERRAERGDRPRRRDEFGDEAGEEESN
jgi:small subunit ribosomal protein S6